MGSKPVYRTADARQDKGIDHRRFDVAMAQKLLDSPNVIAAFEQLSGEGMPEGMTTDILDYLGLTNGFLYGPLYNGLMDVMTTFFSSLGVLPTILPNKDKAAVMAGAERLATSIGQL